MDQSQLYTIPEVAEVLKVSVTQVYRYIKQEENPLKVIYISEKSPRVRRLDLNEWIIEQQKINN